MRTSISPRKWQEVTVCECFAKEHAMGWVLEKAAINERHLKRVRRSYTQRPPMPGLGKPSDLKSLAVRLVAESREGRPEKMQKSKINVLPGNGTIHGGQLHQKLGRLYKKPHCQGLCDWIASGEGSGGARQRTRKSQSSRQREKKQPGKEQVMKLDQETRLDGPGN